MADREDTVKPGSREGKLLVNGFLHLMLSQVSSRLLSFCLNILIARRLSPSEFGLSAVQFQLLTSTILFISREGFRRGCIRIDTSHGPNQAASKAKVVTMAWLSLPAGALMASTACTVVLMWQRLALADPYAQAIILHGISAVVELAGEPLYVLAQSLGLLQLRVALEAVATLLRCLVTFTLLTQGLAMKGGRVFAFAEMAYSATLALGYWAYFIWLNEKLRRRMGPSAKEPSDPVPLLPTKVPGQLLLDPPLLRLCLAFAGQAVVKQVMGQGDKLAMVLIESAYNQGVYGLVDNLGSLVVRMILQPFEESVFTMFSKAGPDRGASRKRVLGRFLALSLKLVVLVGLLFVAFGPPYSSVLLTVLYGQSWGASEASRALGIYCFYIFALALNGTTEAFLHAVATEDDLARSNSWHVAFSLCHMALTVGLVQAAGCSGLLFANCANMAIRVAYSTNFIRNFFHGGYEFSLSRALPGGAALLAFATSAVAAHLSQRMLLAQDGMLPFIATAVHVLIGCGGIALVAASIYVYEHPFLEEVVALSMGKGADSKQE